MKIELQKTTVKVTNTIMEKIYKKLKPILEGNKRLQIKVDNLQKKVEKWKQQQYNILRVEGGRKLYIRFNLKCQEYFFAKTKV